MSGTNVYSKIYFHITKSSYFKANESWENKTDCNVAIVLGGIKCTRDRIYCILHEHQMRSEFSLFFIISAAFYESFCLSYLVHTILGKKIHCVRKNVKFGWRGSLVISFLPDITLWQCQWLSKNTQN